MRSQSLLMARWLQPTTEVIPLQYALPLDLINLWHQSKQLNLTYALFTEPIHPQYLCNGLSLSCICPLERMHPWFQHNGSSSTCVYTWHQNTILNSRIGSADCVLIDYRLYNLMKEVVFVISPWCLLSQLKHYSCFFWSGLSAYDYSFFEGDSDRKLMMYVILLSFSASHWL